MKNNLFKGFATIGLLTLVLSGCSSRTETREVSTTDGERDSTQAVTTETQVQEIDSNNNRDYDRDADRTDSAYLGAASGGRAL